MSSQSFALADENDKDVTGGSLSEASGIDKVDAFLARGPAKHAGKIVWTELIKLEWTDLVTFRKIVNLEPRKCIVNYGLLKLSGVACHLRHNIVSDEAARDGQYEIWVSEVTQSASQKAIAVVENSGMSIDRQNTK